MKKNRVLITGGAGFIGQHMSRLLKKSYSIFIFDNFLEQVHGENASLDPDLQGSCHLIKGCITDKALLHKTILDNKINIIIHLAAETGTGQSMYSANRYFQTNAVGTANIIDILVNHKTLVHKFVLASSRSIYGEGIYLCKSCGMICNPQPRSELTIKAHGWEFLCPVDSSEMIPLATSEDCNPSPQSIYASSKLAQEDIVRIGCSSAKIDYCIFRFQNVYGPGQSLSNPYTGIISIFFNLIRQDKCIDIFEDGKESRDFVFVSDVCNAVESYLSKTTPINSTINIGSGSQTSIIELAKIMFKVFNKKENYEISGNFRLGDIRHNFSDNNRLINKLHYTPATSLEDGIKEFINWAQSSNSKEGNLNKSLEELKKKNLLFKIQNK